MGAGEPYFTISILSSFAPFPYPIVSPCLAPKQNPNSEQSSGLQFKKAMPQAAVVHRAVPAPGAAGVPIQP